MPQNGGIASRNLEARRDIPAGSMCYAVDDRQKPVAEWMRGVIARRNISARAWAEAAGMGKDTVSRAIRDDYASVTSTRTIALLAAAIGEPPFGAARAVPSEASLAAILRVFLSAFAPERPPGPDALQAFALALRETLLHLADEPDDAGDPRTSQALARAAVRRIEPKARRS